MLFRVLFSLPPMPGSCPVLLAKVSNVVIDYSLSPNPQGDFIVRISEILIGAKQDGDTELTTTSYFSFPLELERLRRIWSPVFSGQDRALVDPRSGDFIVLLEEEDKRMIQCFAAELVKAVE
jgi:hypothetical protein